jgi:hypothetical protein
MDTQSRQQDLPSPSAAVLTVILDDTNVKAWLKANTPSFSRLFGSTVSREIHTGEKPDFEPLTVGQIYNVPMLDEETGHTTQVPHIAESAQELISLNRKRLVQKSAYVIRCAELKNWLLERVSPAILSQTARQFSERYHTALEKDDGITLYHLVVQVAKARKEAARQQSPVASKQSQRSPVPQQSGDRQSQAHRPSEPATQQASERPPQRPAPVSSQPSHDRERSPAPLQTVESRQPVPELPQQPSQQASERQQQPPVLSQQMQHHPRPPVAAPPQASGTQSTPAAQQADVRRQPVPAQQTPQTVNKQGSPVKAKQPASDSARQLSPSGSKQVHTAR